MKSLKLVTILSSSFCLVHRSAIYRPGLSRADRQQSRRASPARRVIVERIGPDRNVRYRGSPRSALQAVWRARRAEPTGRVRSPGRGPTRARTARLRPSTDWAFAQDALEVGRSRCAFNKVWCRVCGPPSAGQPSKVFMLRPNGSRFISLEMSDLSFYSCACGRLFCEPDRVELSKATSLSA
jgi:hypothetical protein